MVFPAMLFGVEDGTYLLSDFPETVDFPSDFLETPFVAVALDGPADSCVFSLTKYDVIGALTS